MTVIAILFIVVVVVLGVLIGVDMGEGEVGATIGLSILGMFTVALVLPIAVGFVYVCWGFLTGAAFA